VAVDGDEAIVLNQDFKSAWVFLPETDHLPGAVATTDAPGGAGKSTPW
jgi:hypothetical protein